MVVDQQGWSEVSTLPSGTPDRLLEIQADSSGRHAESDEVGLLSQVEMMHFMSPESEAAQLRE